MRAPVFVLGTPRSGTTLTARILGGHSRLFMPGETHFFDDVYSRRDELGDPSAPEAMARIRARLADLYGRYNEPPDQERVDQLLDGPFSVRSFSDNCASYQDVFTYFMEVQARTRNKPRWGNNTPRDLYNVSDILSFYPDAAIVCCVRDPRDFMLSYKNKWRREEGENARRLKRLYHPLITAMQWKSGMRLALGLREVVPAGRLEYLRYEDLVFRPEQSVRRITDMLGERFEPDMLEVTTHNSSAQGRGAGIFTASAGRWKRKLSAEEAWVAQWVAGPEMKALGYETHPLDVDCARKLKILASAPWGLARALWANRHKRGPIIPYLLKRLAPMAGKGRR